MQAELEKVAKAIGDFYAREGVLFDKDLGERALTHRMAVALERQFDGWDVDCDYNRLGDRRPAQSKRWRLAGLSSSATIRER